MLIPCLDGVPVALYVKPAVYETGSDYAKMWHAGKDMYPRGRLGFTYFSIRDTVQLKELGFNRIVFDNKLEILL